MNSKSLPNSSTSITHRILSALLVAVSLATSATAATYTWTGAGFFGTQDYLWSNPHNWAGLAAPTPGEANVSLIFPNSNAPKITTNDIVGLTVASIQFQGSNYVVHGKPAGNVLGLFSSSLFGYSVSATASNCQFSSTAQLQLMGSGTFNVTNGRTLTIASPISGNGGFSKYGAGTLRLSPLQQNTYTGPVQLHEGTLDLRGGITLLGVFSPATTVPGHLTIGGTNQSQHPACLVSYRHQISDTASVTINQNGQLKLADVDETIGALTLAGGLVDSGTGTLTLNGNVTMLPPTPATLFGEIRGRLHLGNASKTFDVQANNTELKITATVSGGTNGNVFAGVNKIGLGTLTLTGTNTYPGNTLINAGTLKVTHPLGLGSAHRPTSVGTNATLELATEISGAFIQSEGLTLLGGAKLLASTTSTWTGPVSFGGDCTIDVPFTNTLFKIVSGISGPGGFVKTGAGELRLEGPDDNTFTGDVSVMTGTLTLMKGTLAAPGVSVPGKLACGKIYSFAQPVINVLRSETIASGIITIDQDARMFFGPSVTQTVSKLVMGEGEIDTGATGLLKLNGDISTVLTSHRDGVIKGHLDLGNAPRTFASSNSNTLKITAAIQGGPNATLSIFNDTVSNLRLQGSNSYQGLTVVQQGMLIVDHPFSLGGTTAGTIVSNEATLFLATSITNESLQLFGQNDYAGYRTLTTGNSFGETNVWRGPVWLGNDIEIKVFAGHFMINGPISGPGGIIKLDKGNLILAGVGLDNTFAGATQVREGTLTLAKSAGILNSLAIPGELEIGKKLDYGDDVIVRVMGSGQTKSNQFIQINPSSTLRFEHGTNAIGHLEGQGQIWFGTNTLLRIGANGEHTQLHGWITGGDPAQPNRVYIEKLGAGSFVTMNHCPLYGSVDVKQGQFHNAGWFTNAHFYVRAGAALAGGGEFGNVQVDGGTYWAIGTPRVQSLTGGIPGQQPVGNFKMWLNNLTVEMTPNVENLRLLLDIPNLPQLAVGTEILLVSNLSAAPILGTFNHPDTGHDLHEGDKFFAGNQRFAISYVGGDGNDVVLTRVANPVPALLAQPVLTAQGLSFTASGEPGFSYRVEANTNLLDPAGWEQIGEVPVNNAGFGTFIDADSANHSMRFYRLIAP